MRPFGRVRTDFWSHPSTAPLSPMAKLVFVWLATSGHTTCLHMRSVRGIRNHIDPSMQTTVEQIQSAIDELKSAGHVEHDEESEVIWLVNGLRVQSDGVAKNPKWRKGIRKGVDQIPMCEIQEKFRDRYSDFLYDRKPGFLSESDPDPVSDRKEKEKEKEKEPSKGALTPDGAWTALRSRMLEMGHPTRPGATVTLPAGAPRDWPTIFRDWGGLRGVLDRIETWHAQLKAGKGDPSWWSGKVFTHKSFAIMVADCDNNAASAAKPLIRRRLEHGQAY